MPATRPPWLANGTKDSTPRISRRRAASTSFWAFWSVPTTSCCTRKANRSSARAFSQNLIYRGREPQKLDGYTTDLFTDEAIAFIRRHSDHPWFLYLSYNAVHTPLAILEKHQARIPASVTDPDRRGYASLLLGLDDGIGKLTEYLRSSGQDKNTLIFFFSDNGGPGQKRLMAYNTAHNTPLRGYKAQTLEGGIRVPFFVSWVQRLPAGKIYEQPVIALDVLPTALARAGLPLPAECDGVDLLPHLTGEDTKPPHEALYWRFGPQKAIRRGPWKLVDWRDFTTAKNSGWQLYDLSSDIGEQHDLAESHPQLVGDLEPQLGRVGRQKRRPTLARRPPRGPHRPASEVKMPIGRTFFQTATRPARTPLSEPAYSRARSDLRASLAGGVVKRSRASSSRSAAAKRWARLGSSVNASAACCPPSALVTR